MPCPFNTSQCLLACDADNSDSDAAPTKTPSDQQESFHDEQDV